MHPSFQLLTSQTRRALAVLMGAAMVLAAPAMAVETVEDAAAAAPLAIRLNAPAADWEREGLPIGNGALGAVISGGLVEDVIQFNEKTLWTGGPGSVRGYDFGIPPQAQGDALARVRDSIRQQGKISPEAAAQQLGCKIMGYGDYQTFGDLVLTFPKNDSDVIGYQRQLLLDQGKVSISYRQGDVTYTRDYFASYPDGALVVRISADQPGRVSFSASLRAPDNRRFDLVLDGQQLLATGALHDNQLGFAARLGARVDGGQLASGKQHLEIRGADAVTLVLTAATNYAQDYPGYRQADPAHARNQATAKLQAALQHSYSDLWARHSRDYQALYQRVALDIGQVEHSLTTPELLAQYQKGNTALDRSLEATYFQYGRYLLIGSSRPGSLPANLQGVWNNSTTPPWNADYHVNINLQMNYWLAETANLPELMQPYFDFVDSLVEPGKLSAQRIAGVKNGWTLFLNTNIWGFTGVIDWPTAFWQPEAAAWLAQHYYEHFLFARDQQFLRERAYPLMKSAAQFWLEFLIKDPRDGLLVVSPSFSPEQGPFTMGAAMSQQIVFDLLRNTAEAAQLIGDKTFARQLRKTLAKLDTGIRVGSWGQLQEWKEDIDDPKNDHRHISHLFALHPGRQIDAINTPELLQAARTTLNARGDGGTGWSQAWKVNMWARLQDGARAHKVLGEQLQRSTLSNLWDNHPPFQIDGNFGATAGMVEMLVQSHSGVLQLLPALPPLWATGRVTGLRARGGVTLDMDWAKGQLQQLRLHATHTGELRIQTPVAGSACKLRATNHGKPVAIRCRNQQGVIQLREGQTYLLTAG